MEAEYDRRRAAANANYARAQSTGNRYQTGIFVTIAAIAASILKHNIPHPGWIIPVLVVLGAALVFLILRARRLAQRAWRLSVHYERCLERVRGEVPTSGLTGDSFFDPAHLYAADLNLLGSDSLFDWLATTRTAVGQRGLAHLLLTPTDAATARARQQAVKELSANPDLRERVALLGRFKFEDVPAEKYEQWLDAERSNFASWNRWALFAATAAWIAVVVVGLWLKVDSLVLWQNLLIVLVVQAMLCFRLRSKAVIELNAAQRLVGQTSILREGLTVLRTQAFQAPRLKELQQQAEGEDRALKRLERQLDIVEQRPKEWFFAVSLAFCLGTHAAISLDIWKREFDTAMRRWLAAWAEFEALLALATYAAEHEENSYPEILGNRGTTAIFTAEALKHPLLPPHIAVANDVSLGDPTQFLLVSGSNMAGKSTLLRAIGTNAVLALAGAPVAAGKMTLNSLQIGASIAISDSLAEGKSKFLSEVERLKGLVEIARAHPGQMLFLIDEILSGTNSQDRKVATESVLRTLVNAGAIGAISTHDLTLASIADIPELRGENVHMASADEDDPLGFDYLLKPGINRTTNALAIVKMLGLA